MKTKKLTLKEIVDNEAPKTNEGLIRILNRRNSAKSLVWLVLQFNKVEVVYPQDLSVYLSCSYGNAWYVLCNFKRYGLLYSDAGAFHPTKKPNGEFVLKKYLKYAVKTLGYNGYEG